MYIDCTRIDVMNFEITNASEREKNIIINIIEFIEKNYSNLIDISKLKLIEVVDQLDNNSSGRSIKDKIIIHRKQGLNNAANVECIIESENTNKHLRILISTIFHELWHISTWEKYENMYQYVLDEGSTDMYLVFAYMYWIEYIAHIETVFLEVEDIMKDFCENFVHKNWHKIEYGYSYFIKALPYYLIRANYLKIFDKLTKEIKCEELRIATYDFDKESRRLYSDNSITDFDKARIIRTQIEYLFK